MDKQEWINQLYNAMDETSKEDMRCIICNENTRRRGLAFTPGTPTKPIIFAICEVCRELPEWEIEVNRRISTVFLEESENNGY
jgi:hypothetical protein